MRPAQELEAPKEGLAPFDLTIPDGVLGAASPLKLVQFCQQSQEQRIEVAKIFQDVFEHLVTGGKADEYPGLCDRFQARFDAIAGNFERAAERLSSELAIAAMLRSINRDEAKRLELQLQLQVVNQRRSVAEVESEEAVEGKAQFQALEAKMGELTGKIYEALEELRCEAADLE